MKAEWIDEDGNVTALVVQKSDLDKLLRDVAGYLEAQELRARIAAVRPGEVQLARVRELKQRIEAVIGVKP